MSKSSILLVICMDITQLMRTMRVLITAVIKMNACVSICVFLLFCFQGVKLAGLD